MKNGNKVHMVATINCAFDSDKVDLWPGDLVEVTGRGGGLFRYTADDKLVRV